MYEEEFNTIYQNFFKKLIVFDPEISLPKIQPKYTDVSAQRLFDHILKYKQTLEMNNQNL